MIKRVFVTLYITASVALGAWATWVAAQTHDPAWFGVALSGLWSAGFFARLFLAPVARTRRWLPGLLAPVAVGVGLSAAQGLALPLWLGLAIGAGGLVYVGWYSRLDRGPTRLVIGEPLPAFTLATADGTAVASTELRGRPHILLFFRGNWCPLCMAQIREVAAVYRDIKARGAEMVLVSGQRHEKTQALAERFDAPMQFLVDPGLAAARALGIEQQNGTPLGMEVFGYAADTVLPTIIVVDSQGILRAVDQTDNYRIRPEPETFLRHLDQLG